MARQAVLRLHAGLRLGSGWHSTPARLVQRHGYQWCFTWRWQLRADFVCLPPAHKRASLRAGSVMPLTGSLPYLWYPLLTCGAIALAWGDGRRRRTVGLRGLCSCRSGRARHPVAARPLAPQRSSCAADVDRGQDRCRVSAVRASADAAHPDRRGRPDPRPLDAHECTEQRVAARLAAGRPDAGDGARRWISCATGCIARAIAYAPLWRLHEVHHSPDILYTLNVGRFHPLEKALHFWLRHRAVPAARRRAGGDRRLLPALLGERLLPAQQRAAALRLAQLPRRQRGDTPLAPRARSEDRRTATSATRPSFGICCSAPGICARGGGRRHRHPRPRPTRRASGRSCSLRSAAAPSRRRQLPGASPMLLVPRCLALTGSPHGRRIARVRAGPDARRSSRCWRASFARIARRPSAASTASQQISGLSRTIERGAGAANTKRCALHRRRDRARRARTDRKAPCSMCAPAARPARPKDIPLTALAPERAARASANGRSRSSTAPAPRPFAAHPRDRQSGATKARSPTASRSAQPRASSHSSAPALLRGEVRAPARGLRRGGQPAQVSPDPASRACAAGHHLSGHSELHHAAHAPQAVPRARPGLVAGGSRRRYLFPAATGVSCARSRSAVALAPRRSARAGAAELRRELRRRTSRTFADLWPQLRLVVTWTRASAGIAVKALRQELSAAHPHPRAGLSRQRVSRHRHARTPRRDRLADLDTHFFEFVERERWDGGHPGVPHARPPPQGRRVLHHRHHAFWPVSLLYQRPGAGDRASCTHAVAAVRAEGQGRHEHHRREAVRITGPRRGSRKPWTAWAAPCPS